MSLNYGISAAVWSSILSSLGVVIHAETVRLLGPLVVCAFASLFGAVLFFTYFYWRRELPNRRDIIQSLPGLLSLTLLRGVMGALLFVYALSYTSSIKAMFFTKAEPYLVLLSGWLMGKVRIERREFMLLTLHIAAAVTLSTDGKWSLDSGQFGDLLILLSIACSSVSYGIAQNVSRKLGAKTTNAVTQLFACILLLPFALSFSPPEVWAIDNPGWQYLVLQVFMFNIVALTLWYFAIKNVEGWIVSALRAIGPVVAAPFAWLFFDQRLSSLQITAGIVILLTSAAIARGHLASLLKNKKT